MEGSLEHSSGPQGHRKYGNFLNNHKVIDISRKSLCCGLSQSVVIRRLVGWLVGWLVSLVG